MEDLEVSPGSPVLDHGEEPEANNDPGDPLQPALEEEDGGNPPIGDPTADMDAQEGDDDVAQRAADLQMEDDEDEDNELMKDDMSEISELDEQQFDDFDPNALKLPEKPIQIDESNVSLLGVHKRKRTEDEERERRKKKKEGRREKPKKKKNKTFPPGPDVQDDFDEGEEVDARRSRRAKMGPDGRPGKTVRRAATPENEDALSPEERRRRALDRKMDEALRANRPARRLKRDDLEAMGDEEIAQMRNKMSEACANDAKARANGQAAVEKLLLLPKVVELMNRNNIQSSLVDPDLNILESVRFFLEPADQDAALPNYQIQRQLFTILAKLPMTKEALIASGIGKVILFYTKSIQPQPNIKRQAEQLVADWTRIILMKGKDYRNRIIAKAAYDPTAASQPTDEARQRQRAALAAERREKALSGPNAGNRATRGQDVGTYSIAPVNQLVHSVLGGGGGRKAGKSGEEAFRRMAARAGQKSKP